VFEGTGDCRMPVPAWPHVFPGNRLGDEVVSSFSHEFLNCCFSSRFLFFTSTTVTVGMGRIRFFTSAPKELAPNLFRLTRFKKRSVHYKL
jgi:hypothetical protein